MRVSNTTTPDPVGWLVLILSLIGAFTVLKWVASNIPHDLLNGLQSFHKWLITPQISPMGLIGIGIFAVLILVILAYPAVMRL